MSYKVLVASQNKIKALATIDAFKTFRGGKWEIDLIDFEIDSGVNDQPLTLTETATGALNRLERIKNIEGFDYYVAIEGGAYSVELPTGVHWYESACAAVITPDSLQPCVAYGPAYPIQPHISRHLVEGKDLNEAMQLETGIEQAGKGIGFNGWMTDGQLDRRAASSQAVLLALHGLKHQDSENG